MKIETWPITRPIPYGRNARKIPQQAVNKVAASIREFGFRQPIVVDKDDVIVAGHTRLLAAQKLGLDKIAVHIASELSPTQIKAYRLADNRLALETSFDNDLLALELAELRVEDFALELTGFDLDELTAMEALGNSTEEGLTDEDEVPPTPEAAVTAEGDLWTLGNHRLLCGDSTTLAHVQRLMSGEHADLVVTDPPYNIAYEGKTKDSLTIKNDRLGDGAFFDFLFQVYTNLYTILKDGAGIYVFHADTEGLNFRRHSSRAASNWPSAVSGQNRPWSLAGRIITGSMSLSCTAGSRPGHITGIPIANKQPYGTSIAPCAMASTQP